MSSTNKGLYEQCSNCIFKIQNEQSKYPCIKSHKAVRSSDGVKYERDFKLCRLFEPLEVNDSYLEKYN